MNLPFFIANRYRAPRKGAFSSFIIRLAIVATSLSVATMIVAVAIVAGFKHEVKEKLYSFWGHIHITQFTPGNGSIITPQPSKRDLLLEAQLQHTDHVAQVVPFVVRPVIVHGNKLMEGLQLKGVDKDYKISKGISLEGHAIDYSDSDYSKQVLLSRTTANRLHLNAGDDVKLYFLEPGATFPRIRKVKVAGIFHTGMEDVDRGYALCDLRLLQRINNWQPDDINGYQLSLDDPDIADSVSAQIFRSYIQPPLTTYTMKELFPNIIDWLQLQDVNAVVIIVIMALIAMINLLVMLLMLIVEHSRMVGIFKTLGMEQNKIRQIFLYHSAIIAGVGIVAGNIIGLGLCYMQQKTGFAQLPESSYYVKHVPVRIMWWQPVVIDLATLLLCILCMWLPTLYIRRIQPARVLQFK